MSSTRRQKLIERLEDARRREAAARADLEAAIVKAREGGVTMREIAEAAGFKTRKAVYDLLQRRDG